ncbi:MAG: type II secretion system protein [Gemmatimonadota bacterium]
MAPHESGERKETGQKGFTLVELMVVLAIVAILALILTTGVTDILDRTRATRTVNDMRVISAALEGFYFDHGAFPELSGMAEVGDLVSSLVPNYLKALPTTDGWGNPIYYETIVVDSDDDVDGDDDDDDGDDDDDDGDDDDDDDDDDDGDDDHRRSVKAFDLIEGEGSCERATSSVLIGL